MGTLTLSHRKDRTYRDTRALSYQDYGIASDRAIRHTNLLWLCSEMEKLAEDVNDREICRRLRQFAGQIDIDLPEDVVLQIRARRHEDVEVELIPEALLPFYRHYQFMLKRRERGRV